MRNLDQSSLDAIVKDTASRGHIHGSVFRVESEDGSLILTSAAGNMERESRYYIASINKLFISAVILKLCSEGRLSLDAPVVRYLPRETVSGLHRYKGIDHTDLLTLTHLLAHTSGLPCYVIDKRSDGKRLMKDLLGGRDQAWPFDRIVSEVRRMNAAFPPGAPGKARYGDTNYQLLSRIIEVVSGRPARNTLQELVIIPLGMRRTHVIGEGDGPDHVPFYKGAVRRYIPLYLSSTGNDIVSTARDQMIFLKAFFGGYFFPVTLFERLKIWNDIFFPFRYGVGIQLFHLPRPLSPFYAVPDMMGHCGSVGSVAFHVPDRRLYITGTVNQAARPNVAFQTMIKIVRLAAVRE